MTKLRVVVIDDAVVIRKLISQALDADPVLEVVATAPNGKIGLERIYRHEPDIVVLDVEMPVMDGLKTLEELRKTHPNLPVVMFSNHTAKGAATALQAMTRGATECLLKPTTATHVNRGEKGLCHELVEKLKALCAHKLQKLQPLRPQASSPPRNTVAKGFRPEIVTIGVSTGGPQALETVLTTLPESFPVPIVIVQHMPAIFTQLLAERLDAKCRIQIKEGFAGAQITPGTAWIAPGGFHMEIARRGTQKVLKLTEDPPENSCRPAVDVLFRSVARYCGANTLGLILTGMGQDGLVGCRELRRVGARILAQDQASSVVWGMPGAVTRAGLTDRVLPLGTIGSELIRETGGSISDVVRNHRSASNPL